jgi:hypothetical protein
MFEAPVLVDVTKTAPVPMLERPVPDDNPSPPALSPPTEVTARSETPVSLAPWPADEPTEYTGSEVLSDDPPNDDPPLE